MDQILIRDLAVTCIVGTRPHERETPQQVILNIELACDLSRAGASDALADTMDYVTLRDELMAELGASSFYLIERLAQRAAELCLSHATVAAATVTVDKPGALTGARSVAVSIRRERTDGAA
jgi:dihydroneopterin aldolase